MGLITSETALHLQHRGFPRRLTEKYVSEKSAFDLLESSDKHFIECREKCRKYVDQLKQQPPGIGLVLVGVPGSGKSLLATAIIIEVLKRQGTGVRMVNVDQVIMSVNSKWTRDRNSGPTVDIYSPKFLVIDNFPQTLHQSRNASEVVQQVFQERFNCNKHTIITAACTRNDLKNLFSREFFSYLTEAAFIFGDLCEAVDYRQTIKPKLF